MKRPVPPVNGFAGFEGFAGINCGDDRGAESSARPCGSDPWPVPRPISGTLAEVPALDPDLLPESIRSWVVDLAERHQVPVDYPAAAVITMLAGALGRRALIRPKRHDDWVVYGNLWGAIVGKSGIMKTPILHAALGPLRRRQSLAIAIHDSELDEYRRQLAEIGRQRRPRHRAAAGVLPAADGLEFDGQKPQPPVCTRYVTNEISIEKLHLVLKEIPEACSCIETN